jgi:MFS family permease
MEFYLKNFVEITLENWFLILPLSILLYFAARFFESITIFMVGAAIGFFYISPFVMGWISEKNFNIHEVLDNLMPYIIAILIGIAFLAIYKIAIFFLVAIASGGLVYFVLRLIIDSFPKVQETIPNNGVESAQGGQIVEYILIAIAVVIGIIGGFVGAKKSKQFFQVFSVILGSLGIVFSGYVITMMLNYNDWKWSILTEDLDKSIADGETLKQKLVEYISNNFSTIHAAIVIVLIIILCILKFRKRTKTAQNNQSYNQ